MAMAASTQRCYWNHGAKNCTCERKIFSGSVEKSIVNFSMDVLLFCKVCNTGFFGFKGCLAEGVLLVLTISVATYLLGTSSSVKPATRFCK